MGLTRFCPRCNTDTPWGNDDGGLRNYCLNVRTDEQGRPLAPCGFHLEVQMSGAEQFNFDQHVGHVQREHVFEQPPARRRYQLV